MRQYEDHEDHMLIKKAKGGDASAYEHLVLKYRRFIYNLCFSLTGAPQTADDMAQDTFIKAYAVLAKFKEGMRFYPWIRRIAVNRTLNHLKSRRRERPLDPEFGDTNRRASWRNNPQDTLINKQREEQFFKALHSLPADQKTIFILRLYEDMSYSDIAGVLKIPSGTVMSRLNRARQKLKSMLVNFL
ncbi:MAG: RNA polymerase sigma factor [Nanoarchaeota archaeon]|nr:RNA polymerase sigma factor [Nanoarchaeota archaeon]